MLTPETARTAILNGNTVKMVVGADPEDPTLLVTLHDGCVYAAAVAGWSAGVTEPVCDAASPFLLSYLSGYGDGGISPHDLTLADPGSASRAQEAASSYRR